MGLASLFKRLLGRYGDDAARIIANNADDAARVIANQSDDVARIVANNADDVLDAFDETGPLGNTITHYYNIPGRVDIDGKPFHYPIRYTPQNALKEKLLDARTGLGKPDPGDFTEFATVLGRDFPKDQLAYGIRPHSNTALGRWFNKAYTDIMRGPVGVFTEIGPDELPF